MSAVFAERDMEIKASKLESDIEHMKSNTTVIAADVRDPADRRRHPRRDGSRLQMAIAIPCVALTLTLTYQPAWMRPKDLPQPATPAYRTFP
jgi:hypothetical protein